eukprot:436461-Rhodomonas_salina.2
MVRVRKLCWVIRSAEQGRTRRGRTDWSWGKKEERNGARRRTHLAPIPRRNRVGLRKPTHRQAARSCDGKSRPPPDRTVSWWKRGRKLFCKKLETTRGPNSSMTGKALEMPGRGQRVEAEGHRAGAKEQGRRERVMKGENEGKACGRR